MPIYHRTPTSTLSDSFRVEVWIGKFGGFHLTKTVLSMTVKGQDEKRWYVSIVVLRNSQAICAIRARQCTIAEQFGETVTAATSYDFDRER